MLLQHQLAEMDLYSLPGFNANLPITVPVRRIPSRWSRGADRPVIVRQTTPANGLDAVPFERESVVGHAVIRVEPEVERVVRGHDIPVLVRKRIAAKSADHLTPRVSTIVYLYTIEKNWFSRHVRKGIKRSILTVPAESRTCSRSSAPDRNGWTWRSTPGSCSWSVPRHSSARVDKRSRLSGIRDVPRDYAKHRRTSVAAFRIWCRCTSTGNRSSPCRSRSCRHRCFCKDSGSTGRFSRCTLPLMDDNRRYSLIKDNRDRKTLTGVSSIARASVGVARSGGTLAVHAGITGAGRHLGRWLTTVGSDSVARCAGWASTDHVGARKCWILDARG